MADSSGLPLRAGDAGEAVRDVQHRLQAIGFAVHGTAGTYDEATAEAVRSFQRARGLAVDAICGHDTWNALVEAGFRVGDRLLYLRRPMLRGDDVAELQRKLGSLGFDTGRVDGIFGPDTERAVKEFQRNAGATVDGICGPEVLAALDRLGAWADAPEVIASIRERHLFATDAALDASRIVVAQQGGLEQLARAVRDALSAEGAAVEAVHHIDASAQASAANDFGADAFVGVGVSADEVARTAYYATEGFVSARGQHLAELLAAGLASVLPAPPRAEGMRIPVLRETRMPAVMCYFPSIDAAVGDAPGVAAIIVSGLDGWTREPVPRST